MAVVEQIVEHIDYRIFPLPSDHNNTNTDTYRHVTEAYGSSRGAFRTSYFKGGELISQSTRFKKGKVDQEIYSNFCKRRGRVIEIQRRPTNLGTVILEVLYTSQHELPEDVFSRDWLPAVVVKRGGADDARVAEKTYLRDSGTLPDGRRFRRYLSPAYKPGEMRAEIFNLEGDPVGRLEVYKYEDQINFVSTIDSGRPNERTSDFNRKKFVGYLDQSFDVACANIHLMLKELLDPKYLYYDSTRDSSNGKVNLTYKGEETDRKELRLIFTKGMSDYQVAFEGRLYFSSIRFIGDYTAEVTLADGRELTFGVTDGILQGVRIR